MLCWIFCRFFERHALNNGSSRGEWKSTRGKNSVGENRHQEKKVSAVRCDWVREKITAFFSKRAMYITRDWFGCICVRIFKVLYALSPHWMHSLDGLIWFLYKWIILSDSSMTKKCLYWLWLDLNRLRLAWFGLVLEKFNVNVYVVSCWKSVYLFLLIRLIGVIVWILIKCATLHLTIVDASHFMQYIPQTMSVLSTTSQADS